MYCICERSNTTTNNALKDICAVEEYSGQAYKMATRILRFQMKTYGLSIYPKKDLQNLACASLALAAKAVGHTVRMSRMAWYTDGLIDKDNLVLFERELFKRMIHDKSTDILLGQ